MKLNLIIIFCFIVVIYKAQIPNNSFETWTTISGYQTPVGWDNLNQITYLQGVFTCAKLSPGNPGNYYLSVISRSVTGKGIVPGRIVSGKIDTVTYKPISGYPFTLRPQSLSYNIQYMPYDPSDSSSVKVLLTKWNGVYGKRDTVAIGASYYNAMAHTWFVGSTYLNYKNGDAPDSACIVISSSGNNPKNGSYIYIDNLQFNGSVIGINELNLLSENIMIFPNPAKETLNIKVTEINSSQPLEIRVYSVSGKIIYESSLILPLTSINTLNWAKGLYTIVLTQNKNSIHKQIVIN